MRAKKTCRGTWINTPDNESEERWWQAQEIIRRAGVRRQLEEQQQEQSEMAHEGQHEEK